MSTEIAAVFALESVTEMATNLRAMLAITLGDSGERFRRHPAVVQEALLNACDALAVEIIAEATEYEVRNA